MTVTYLVIDGEIISENRNGVERDYLPDPQGNVIALLDNTQTKTDTFTYWPYGELKNRTGSTPTPFQYGDNRFTSSPEVPPISVKYNRKLRQL